MSRQGELRRRFPVAFYLLLYLLFTLPFALLLRGSEFLRFASLSLLVAIALLLNLIFRWDRNHPLDSKETYPDFGLPNYITMFRGICLAISAGTLSLASDQFRWYGAGFYTAAIIADYFDGFAARRLARTSELGSILDVEFDSAGVMIASLSVVLYRIAGPWFLLVGLARYLFIFGMFLRRTAGRDNAKLEGSLSGRLAAGMQMGFMATAWWPVIASRYLAIAAFVFSGFFFASFLRDWLVVSRLVVKTSRFYSTAERVVRRNLLPIVQLICRIAPTILLIRLSSDLPPIARILAFLLAFFLIIGALGRVAAMALIILLMIAGSWITPYTQAIELILLVAFIVGTGPFSLAEPERRLFSR